MMLTARSFATPRTATRLMRTKEFGALGMANLAAAILPGFAISGSGFAHRGQRRQRRQEPAGLHIATAVIALVTLLPDGAAAIHPHRRPRRGAGAASCRFTDFRGLWALRDSDRAAFWLALRPVCRAHHGGLPASPRGPAGLFQFLRNAMRPTDQLLGMDDEGRGAHPGDNSRPRRFPASWSTASTPRSPASTPPATGGGCWLLLAGSPQSPGAWWWTRWSASPTRTSVMSMVGAAQGACMARHPHAMAGRHGQMSQCGSNRRGSGSARDGDHPLPRHVSGPAHDPLLPGAGVQMTRWRAPPRDAPDHPPAPG